VKALTFKVSDSLAEAIRRVAALQGLSTEEWLLRAARCILEGDLTAQVEDIIDVDVEAELEAVS
jgi:hypothetical protein